MRITTSKSKIPSPFTSLSPIQMPMGKDTSKTNPKIRYVS
jgi:hypothetical protein